MTKKQILGIIALILSLLMAVSVFVGCNSTAPESAQTPAATEQNGSANKKTDEIIEEEVNAEEASPFTEYIKAEQEAFETLFPVSTGIKDVKFDESSLKNEIIISDYCGKDFDIYSKDMGDGSYMHVAKETNLQQFSRFLTELIGDGATYYTSNKIGSNFFVTLVTKKQIINTMYFKTEREVRVTVDDRAKFSLPGLVEENTYQIFGRASLTMVAIEETGWPGGMGFIYELTDGSFLIVDGGYTNRNDSGKTTVSSANWFTKTIKKLARDPENIRIAAWFITHPHRDHYGALVELAESAECLEDIKIEKVIYNNPAEQYLSESGTTLSAAWMETAIEKWNPDEIVKAHPGQVIYVRDAVLTVYSSPDVVLPCDEKMTDANNFNTVAMIDYQGKRGLYMGDSSWILNPIIARIYNKDFKADILQLAHHGYGDTDAGKVYTYVDPSIVLWPMCTSHFRDICSGVGFNRQFFSDGIDNHVALRENLTIRDFKTWQPESRWDPTK